ncbi:MAG: hypothetical protein ACRC46_09000 [Thermoguttaceae bacterium]
MQRFLLGTITGLLFCATLTAHAASLVFDFETGNLDSEGWIVAEGENARPIGVRDNEFHTGVAYAKHGKAYLTTLEQPNSDAPTDDVRCVIESPVFTITGSPITLRVGGGKRENTYVGLCLVDERGEIGEPVLTARGRDSQGLDEVVWDTSPFLTKAAVIRVVDLETGSWAHIRVDDIRIDGQVDATTTELRRVITGRMYERLAALWDESRARRDAAAKAAREVVARSPILYVHRAQYVPDHHNTETMFQTGEINTGSFRGGSSLKLWNPANNSVVTLVDVPDGIVRDPCISFDAKEIVVSLRKSIDDDYHIYRLAFDPTRPTIVVRADTDVEKIDGLTQITFARGVSDIDPLYLPNGRILFSSTREPKFCMCNRHIMANLYTIESDGANLLQIGRSTLFEGHAQLLSDGRVIYDRWEYVDRNFGDAQGVWVTNPDGTNHAIYWGNNTASPGGVLDAIPLPSDDATFLATFSSCHDRPWGAIALVKRDLGLDGKQAVVQTWPAEARDLVDVGGYDTFTKLARKFEDPFPLDDEWILASGMTGNGEEMGIYLLGRDGSMTLVHSDAPGCFDPQPIRVTTPPPVIADRVDFTDPNGYFYVSNVYEGFEMSRVPKGSVKWLRIVESPEKRFWTQPAWDGGTGQQAPGMAWNDFNNKRIIGTVPVEEDGSVYFSVPADTYVYFQLLDERGMMLQTMRSGTIARPGETNGCYGCHEDRLATFAPLPYTPAAMTKPPQTPQDWYGPRRLFSYLDEVQPVFEKYCLACHDKVPAGGTKPQLSGDLNLLFNTSYVQLQQKKLVNATGAGPHTKLPPLSWGSQKSRIVDVIANGHPRPEIDERRRAMGVFLDPEKDRESWDRIVTWIDINAPYYPTYASAYPNNRFGRAPLDEAKLKRLQELCGVDLTWTVSFTRPERSLALAKWSTPQERESSEYREALAIIEEGAANLARQGRGDHHDFKLVVPSEIEQQKKYERLAEVERRMRDAVTSGKKLYERDTQTKP